MLRRKSAWAGSTAASLRRPRRELYRRYGAAQTLIGRIGLRCRCRAGRAAHAAIARLTFGYPVTARTLPPAILQVAQLRLKWKDLVTIKRKQEFDTDHSGELRSLSG